MTSSEPSVTTAKSRFSMTCTVVVDVAAPPERVWALLTDADAQRRWNTTLTRIEGPIAVGKKVTLEVAAAPGRTFKPKVTAMDAPRTMVWSDGFAPMFRGQRTFTLEAVGGGTRFTMSERFAGLMLPMIKKALPDFAPIFARYAADLARAAG